MPRDPLQPIHAALEAGDKTTAQTLLRPMLKQKPSAELWYLAALACTKKEKAVQCVQKALKLDPKHAAANRLCLKLEGVKATAEQPSLKTLTAELPPLKKVSYKKKRSGTRTLVLICLLLFAMSCSLITMNMVGIITGPVTWVTVLTGGATPVRELDGTPIASVSDAPLRVEASQSKPLEARDTDVLEPGYAHEYTFASSSGAEVAIYVQFMSLAANKVSRNVVLVRPNGSNATGICERDAILQGDNNITLTCTIDATGQWKLRILGREGESVGAYFVGMQHMQGF